MNKAKKFAIALSALLLAGVATTGLASSCGTSISQATATCLSTTATTNFIENYQANLSAQGGNDGSSYGSSMAPKSEVTNSDTNQKNETTPNNNTDTKNKGINWF